MSRGVLYIATGEKYGELAAMSARSVMRHNPTIPIYIHRTSGEGLESRVAKLSMDLISPFDETIFLDCDTLVGGSIENLVEKTKTGIAAALDFGPKTCGEVLKHRWFNRVVDKSVLRHVDGVVPKHMPHFNTGVLVFRKEEKAKAAFLEWRTIWNSRPPAQDQLAFMEMMHKTGFKPDLLGPEWNYQYCVTKAEAVLKADLPQVKILHLAGWNKAELYRRARAQGWL